MAAEHSLTSRPQPISEVNVSHRAKQAVDYYKQNVAPRYNHNSSKAIDFMHRSSHPEVMNGVDRASSFDDLRSGAASVNSNSFYRPKMKQGVIDMRSSFSAAQQRSVDYHGSQEYHFDKYKGDPPRNADRYGSVRDHSSHNQRQDSHGMYKSSSNMEIDTVDGIDDDTSHNTSLKREYGSTSSLDILGASTDSFFTMLNDLKTENLDQRSPAPAKLAEFLKGKVDKKGQVVKGNHAELEAEDHSSSPKFKSKFKHKDRKSRSKTITGETGILKKLRGKTEHDAGNKVSEHSEGDSRFDERLRKKAFTHYDCQSIGFDVNNAKESRTHNSLKNISTGASAASASRNSIAANESQNPDVIADVDDGDGRSNDLVLTCPFFRNELGGEEERLIALSQVTAHKRSVMSPPTEASAISLVRPSTCTGLSILDSSPTPSEQILPPLVTHRGHIIEFVDHGCTYYRHYFMDYDHQNYFGVDENFGPIALSIRREKIFDRGNSGSSKTDYGHFQYRIIFRTSELTTLRGSILEDAVHTTSRFSSSRGLPMKDIVDFILPEVQTSCLKPGCSDKKTYEQMVKLDETALTTQYRIGILYCKAGQSTEEEMYNNETAGPAFEEFLELIGNKVRLKGLETYRAQLDNKTDSTGTHSVYTHFNNCEIMFHVSTLLPFTHNNRQQLLRKRHVGNDIVTIIFQEPGSLPFTAMSIRSHYQHIFVVVRVHEPNTERTRYSISVSRSKDVPPFGPPFAENMTFPKSKEFRDFLLAKLLNGESAAHKSEKFKTMAIRTRQEYLRDLAMNHISTSDSGSKLSKFALGSGRKKEKAKQKVIPDLLAKAAVIWNVQIEDFGLAAKIDCLLGIAFDTIVVLEKGKDVIFTMPCSSVIGWTPGTASLRLYFNQGDFILLHTKTPKQEELNEILHRLLIVTQGCETLELNLKRNGLGQLGFHVQPEGIITDVEGYGFAEQAGLVRNSRLVEICKVARTTLQHEQMLDLLRTSATVCVVVIPPFEDGKPRGGEIRPVKNIPASNTERHHFTERNPHRQPYHAYTDSSVSSVKDSIDSHHTPDSTLSRSTGDSNLNRLHNSASNGTFDSSHSREESHDSSDQSSSAVPGLSQSWNLRTGTDLPSQSQGNTTRWHEFAKELAASNSIYLGSTETVNDMSASTNSFSSRKSVAQPSADYISFAAPPTGNIALELLKQCQNTKYLLNQKNGNSRTSSNQHKGGTGSSNLSHLTSVSSQSDGNTHHSSTYPPSGHRSQENLLTSSSSKDDLSVTKRKDSAPLLNRTRPKTISYRNPQLSASPISSPTSSPRSSDRNLSGMSSEESLTSKPRSASITGSKPLKLKAESITNLQNKLMKLIDPDSIESDHPKYPFGALSRMNMKRTVSDESLHSSQRIADGDLFSSGNTATKSAMSKEQRLSPRAIADSTLTSSRSKVSSSRNSPAMPLLESTAGLDWSNLVNVATKAIEGDQADQTQYGNRDKDVLNTASDSSHGKNEAHGSQVTLKSGPTVWHSTTTNPHQRIEELEGTVATLQEQLVKEREKRIALDEEVQDLRIENIRLQEESQTAAAQLRKFTEWFFSTIDRH